MYDVYDADYDYIDSYGNPAFYSEQEIAEMEADFAERLFQEDEDRAGVTITRETREVFD